MGFGGVAGMINSLLYICLSALVGITVRAYALPIVKRIVAIRNWLCVVFASEEGEAHSEEMLANLPDEIAYYRLDGDSNDVIAARIFFRLVMGLPGDIAMWAPSIPALFVDKIVGWNETLRHSRVPAAMIAGVAVLGPVNYSYFSSQSNLTVGSWLLVNCIGIIMTIVMWKHKHPLARRIFHAWMGIAMAGGVGALVWMTVQYRLYEIMTFKVLLLAMVAVLPAIIVVDKSWRNRLFRGRWWLIAICWAPIIAGSLAGSMLIAHDVKPLLETWATMALLVVGMFIVYGGIVLASYVLCWLGIRGSAGGLRLVASGIRRLR